jgi:hypothetical protein
MVDSVSNTSNALNIVDAQGNVSQDIVSGNFDAILGENSSLGPDALALLKAQQKISLDMERFQLASQIVKDQDETKKQMIRNS